MDNGQIMLFRTQGRETKIEVRLSNDTERLTTEQMVEMFQCDRSTIQRHIKTCIRKTVMPMCFFDVF